MQTLIETFLFVEIHHEFPNTNLLRVTNKLDHSERERIYLQFQSVRRAQSCGELGNTIAQ